MEHDKTAEAPAAVHRLSLEGRRGLTVSGVEEVERFDEECILLTTAMGGLEIRGEGLHVARLSVEGGDLKVEGRVDALSYDVEPRQKGGLLSRLFGP